MKSSTGQLEVITPEVTLADHALVKTQQIRLLYLNLDYGVKISLLAAIAIVLAVFLRGPLPTSVAWWGGLTILWVIAGYGVHRWYRYAAPTDQELRVWGQRATGGCAIAGALWGSIGFCALDPAARALDPLFIAVAALLAMGVFAGYFCYLPAMYAFVTGISVTFIASRLLVGDSLQLIVAGVLTLTLLFAVIVGRHFNRLLSNEIIMRSRNARLVDDLTKKQAQIEAANRAKTRFLAAASHDLRQPVHAINLYSALLQDHVPQGEGQMLLGRMQQSVQALDGLFESIEDIAKFEAGIITPRIAPVRLETLCARLHAAYEGIALAKGLHFKVVVGREVVMTDIALLERILGNLISNAVRYTDHGGIEVTSAAAQHNVRVSVRDTGIGIPAEHLSEIFLEFVQLHNPHRGRQGGLGLGLSIVKHLTTLLDHPLEVHSEPGRGSRFQLTLPLAASQDVPQEGHHAESLLVTEHAGRFVVIIDDDPDVRHATERVLQRWRCHVLSGAGAELVEAIAREARLPDLIISDLRLRENESGIEVIKRIRWRLDSAVPAIIVTGDVEPERVREAATEGIPLVHKPLTAQDLRNAITQLLENPAAQE